VCPLCFVLVGYDPSPQLCYERHMAWHQAIRDGQEVRTGLAEVPAMTTGDVVDITARWDAPMPTGDYAVVMAPIDQQNQVDVEVLAQDSESAQLRLTSILPFENPARTVRVTAHAPVEV
jgi:hypothetical protein